MLRKQTFQYAKLDGIVPNDKHTDVIELLLQL